MHIEQHALVQEFPEYRDQIHELKMNDGHFARLFDEYHELDHQIVRIEDQVEVTTDEFLEGLKKQRLKLKDRLFGLLKQTH